MTFLHQSNPVRDLDFFGLHLFRAVAEARSFTQGGEQVGLTQSAASRRIKQLEETLGFTVFERTTRLVRLTPAGKDLLKTTESLLTNLGQDLSNLQQAWADRPLEIRIGVSQLIGFAHLPGLFHQFHQRYPEVICDIKYKQEGEILTDIVNQKLDLAVVTAPRKLPTGVEAIHTFGDSFTGIAPKAWKLENASFEEISAKRWLLPTPASETGSIVGSWFTEQKLPLPPAMYLNSFDLIVNLVSLEMGVSFVPKRVLALYGKRRSITRFSLTKPLSRNLSVVVRKSRKLENHVNAFIENILFGHLETM